MTPEHKIARHHLGDTLTTLMRGGPHAADWIVFARHGATEVSTRAPTVEEAARNAADQLRAAGWEPTHPRLEWESRKWQHHLCFLTDSFRVELFFVYNGANGWTVWRRHDADNEVTACRVAAPVAAQHIADWCAANLPNYHLPPFPETPDAS